MSLAEIDGNIYGGQRDPPGQSTLYIPPGDNWKENYRLSTFRHFPSQIPLNPSLLAKNGFYWTGYRDRVKCFSCGLCVENWIQGDKENDKRWHRNNCDFSNGRDTTNIPLNFAFTQFLSRKAPPSMTSLGDRNPSGTRDVNHTSSVTSTSHSPGNSPPHNRNNNENIPPASNHTTSNNTPPASNSQSRVNDVNHTPTPAQSGSSEAARAELFPCLAPVNPHMSSTINRLESFKERNGIRWPREKVRARIEDFANAGFFYLGERDRVKCWYCNGGLQNFEYDDEPWVEHAKWFPTCEFTLRMKGPVFVENIVAAFPNIDRPVPSTIRPSRRPPAFSVTTTASRSPSSGNRSLDIGPIDQAVELGMEMEYVKQAKEMGIDEKVIREVMRRKYAANGQFYNSPEEFMEAVFSHNARTPTSQSIQSRSAASNSAPTETTNNAQEELRELEESRLCKICKKEPSNVVLVPCGHLPTCDKCCEGLKKCPICKRKVKEVIKTFRA